MLLIIGDIFIAVLSLNDSKKKEKGLSEVGFEPTPTEVDCDLNAAP